ncbi:putative integral membrane protein PTH11 [Rosellinia necatrix]|uniref:Putative integral membrane protein PTH11 n=1 Tax=Rosellinia necatrix TaxID=77044 RepID=A0A1W2TFU8_ROSNE|nr:putative integral membrane protein PTH11 [Rosellinia necatrix]
MDLIPYLPKEQQELLLAGPALAPPNGTIANFENPPNKNEIAHATFVICIFFATFSFLVRMYARLVGLRAVKLEDGLTFVAYATFIGYIYCCYRLMAEYGYFIHQWDLHLGDLIEITYILQIGGVLYSVTLPLLKASILLEWTRLFVPQGTRNLFWWLCVILSGIQLSFLVASVFALSFACIPYEKIWDFTVAGTCIKKSELEIASAAIHFTSDLVILVLPQRVIWSLHMTLRKKVGVSVIFSLGVLACLSAILRLVSTIEYSTSDDVTYAVSAVVLWALAEMTCGFIVLGMPTAPKVLLETGLINKIKSSFRSWSGSRPGELKSTGLSDTPKSSNTVQSYRKIDDRGVPLQTLKSVDGSESTERLRDLATRPENSIIRTTHLSTTEDYDYGRQVQYDQLQRQHPWCAKE